MMNGGDLYELAKTLGHSSFIKMMMRYRGRNIGFQANRRLLQTQHITHDCILAEETFQQLNRPRIVEGQRASALRFADPMVQAIWNALLLFDLLTGRIFQPQPANECGR